MILFLLSPVFGLSQSIVANDSIQDANVVGVIKVFVDSESNVYSRLEYVSPSLEYGGFQVYDAVIRIYLENLPLLYPMKVYEALRNNFNKYSNEYKKLDYHGKVELR